MSMIINPYAFTPGSLWTPADLGTPPLFWVNDDSNVTDAGSGACSQWDDISGNNFHVTQGTNSLRPLIVTSGLNGRRTIRADGTDDRLTNSNATFRDAYRLKSSAWLACVFKKNGTGTTGIRFVFYSSTNTLGAARFSFCSTAVGTDTPQLRVRRLDGDAVTGLDSGASIGTEWNAWLIIMDWSTGDGFIYKNGSLDVQNLSLTTSGNTSNTGAANEIALFNLATGGFASGIELAELATGSNYIPTGTEINNFFTYFSGRWGI